MRLMTGNPTAKSTLQTDRGYPLRVSKLLEDTPLCITKIVLTLVYYNLFTVQLRNSYTIKDRTILVVLIFQFPHFFFMS